MAAEVYLLGKDAEVAIMSAGSPSSPTWSVMYGWGDVTISDERDELNTTTRGGEFETTDPGLRKLSLEGEVPYNTGDSAMGLLKTAFDARTSVYVRILDQAHTVTGAQGFIGPMKVMKFSRAEPVNGVQMRSIALKPCAPNTGAGEAAFTTTSIS